MENFFYIGSQLDEVKIKDLLLSRYGTFNLELELMDFCEIVMLAIEEKKRAEKREEWLALLPLMVTAGKYKSFEEYYDLASGKGIFAYTYAISRDQACNRWGGFVRGEADGTN